MLTSILNDDEAMTARNEEITEHSDDTDSVSPVPTSTVSSHYSDTLSVQDSETMSIGSDTLSASSDEFSNSCRFDVEVEIHEEPKASCLC